MGFGGRHDQRLGARGHLAVQQRRGHRGLLRRGLARVGQRAPQPVLGVEQPDHREQLVASPVATVALVMCSADSRSDSSA